MKRTRGDKDSKRALTPVVGIALLLAVVVLGMALVWVTGTSALNSLSDRSSMERAEQSMIQFKSELADLEYTGNDRDMSVEWFDGEPTSIETDGTISFELNPQSPGPPACDPRTEIELQTLRYETESGTIAYQGGGVFRQTAGGSEIVSAPDLSHRSTTVDGTPVWTIRFPMMSITEPHSGSDSEYAKLVYDSDESAAERQRIQDDLCLPPNEHDFVLQGIRIEVQNSSYQDAWKRFLEDELGGNSTVTLDEANDRVVATAPLGSESDTEVSPEDFEIWFQTSFGGVHSTAATEVHLQNIDVDGYDSRSGSYDDSRHEKAVIGTVGDLHFTGGTIYGDACVNGDLTGSAKIEGSTDCTVDESVDQVDVGGYVSLAERGNDNNDTSAITDGTFDAGSHTLETGVYYLDSVDLGAGDGLEIDTSGGDVVIAVDGDVDIHGADVRVTGPNDVRWFVRGTTTIDEATVGDDDGHRSTANWLFVDDDVTIHGGTTFVGVTYAPNLDVTVNGGTGSDETHVYGALAGDVDISSGKGGGAPNTELHHDTAINGYIASEYDYGDGSDGTITGPGDVISFDAEVTFVDAEFAANAYDSFPVSLPVEPVDNPDDDLDHLEYWQAASSRATESTEGTGWSEAFAGSTTSNCFWFYCSTPSDTQEFDGELGDHVTVTADTANADAAQLTLRGPGGSVIATGSDTLEATLPSTGEYEIEIETNSETSYDLELEGSQPEHYYEEITFDATEHDEVTIELESGEADPAFTVHDSDGNLVATGTDPGDVSETFRTYSDGEFTIRVFSQGVATPFDYDITLKRTHVYNAPVYRQGPIETALIFQYEDGTVDRHSPWPETDLETVSDGTPGHAADVNHPGVEYPMSYEVTDLPANTTFSAELQWRYTLCSNTDSYAGTTRTHDGQTYFELGCGDGGDNSLENRINVIEDSTSERIRILEDGDEVPDIDPSEAQRSMQDMLGSKLDTSGDTPRMNLDDGEFAVVFELANDPSNPTWEMAKETGAEPPDYNDVVLLYEITNVEREGGDESEETAGSGDDYHGPTQGDDYGYTLSIDNGVVVFEGS